MKVRELIEELNKYDPEEDVHTFDRLYGYAEPDILVSWEECGGEQKLCIE